MDNLLLKGLLDNLTSELKTQTNLLKLLSSERNEIVHLRATELDKVREQKEELLSKLSKNKDKRSEILEPIEKTLDPKKPFLLSSLFESAPKDIKSSYEKISTELKAIAISVQKMNKENAGLLRQTLGLVSSTISIITARPTIDNTNYKKDGKVEGDQTNVGKLGSVSSFNRSV